MDIFDKTRFLTLTKANDGTLKEVSQQPFLVFQDALKASSA